MATYSPLPIEPARGEGAIVWDWDGRQYIDLVAGVGVNGLGHAHPRLAAALQEQVAMLIHCSNLYRIREQEELAETLAALSGADRMFFCNSGCEANEAAIKLVRRYAYDRGNVEPVILVADGAFHGRTMATLTATSNPKVRAGFGPLLPGFECVPYNDPNALRNAGDRHAGTVAVMLEPIQGEGGINMPSVDYLRAVRQLCNERGWLLVLDEVQTGIGRTGQWFAHQHAGISPDVMTLAKGLGSGIPIGACLAWGAAADTFNPGSHGSTFGGNPLACRAALTTLAVLAEDGLLARATTLGHAILAALREDLAQVDGVVEIRGLGMMLGIELDRRCEDLMRFALSRGLMINVTGGRVVRLLPPLVLTDEQAALAVRLLADTIRDYLKAQR